MAIPVYATFKDDQGNKIKAGVEIQGREGMAEGHAFDYAVSIPADKNTGQLTAVRKHSNVILTKVMDSASPALFNAVCRGKTFQSVQLDWHRINENGAEEIYFTHILTDVKIVKLRQFMAHVKMPENDSLSHQEEVHLRFRKIEMNYPQGNIRASDDWTESRTSMTT